MVFADCGDARFIAADLIAQAEHDPDAISIFVTTSGRLARGVAAEIEKPARAIARDESGAAIAR